MDTHKRSLLCLSISALLALTSACGAQPQPPPPLFERPPAAVYRRPPPGTVIVHHVQWGETLMSIAARYGVSLRALIAANQIANIDLIYVNATLLIPTPQTVNPSTYAVPARPRFPVVRRPAPNVVPAYGGGIDTY